MLGCEKRMAIFGWNKEIKEWTGEMVPQLKAPDTVTDDLRSIHRTYMMEGKYRFPEFFSDFCTCTMVSIHYNQLI